MTTRQNPMAGRYFNDPNFAAAVSNLASAFAPPSPEEYLMAEKVKGLRTSNAALADAYGLAAGDFDKLGVVADLYDPSNSYYSVDTEAATARRGQDVSAATALDKARIDGMFGLAGTPLAYNEAMPGLPADVAAAIGVPEFAPAAGAALGAPAPALNESEMIARIMADEMTTDERRAIAGSNIDPVQIVGEGGKSTYADPLSALGQEAFVNTGGTAAADPVMLIGPDGKRVSGFATPSGGYVLGDGKTPAPPGFVAYKLPQIQGTAEDVGGTGSNKTSYNEIQAITAESDMLIDSLVAEVQNQAGAVGIAGTLQNLQQNLGQVFSELNAAYGDADGLVTPEMMSGLVATDGSHDPTFARLRSGMLQLAYLNAQRDNPSGEVSRFALERQLEALSQGMLANDNSFLAALAMNKEANARKRAAAEALIGNTVVPPAPGQGAAPPPAAAPAAGGNVTSSGVQWSIEP